MIVTANASDKRQCVSDSDRTINNSSIIDLEVDKSKQNMSISSISGYTPVSDIAKPLSIIQCSDNWVQMHHSIKMEEKQNKKRIETFVKHHPKIHCITRNDELFFSNTEFELFDLRQFKHKGRRSSNILVNLF